MNIQISNNLTQTQQPARVIGSGVNVVKLPQVEAKQKSEQHPSAEQLSNMVSNINSALKQAGSSLEFSVDASTKKTVIKLLDTETGDLIRQFPSEEMLAISRSIDRIQQGLLLKQKV